jgi:hypothetical protein
MYIDEKKTILLITYNVTEDRRSAGIGDSILVHLNQIKAIRVQVGKWKEMIFERRNIVCWEMKC